MKIKMTFDKGTKKYKPLVEEILDDIKEFEKAKK